MNTKGNTMSHDEKVYWAIPFEVFMYVAIPFKAENADAYISDYIIKGRHFTEWMKILIKLRRDNAKYLGKEHYKGLDWALFVK